MKDTHTKDHLRVCHSVQNLELHCDKMTGDGFGLGRGKGLRNTESLPQVGKMS